MPLLQSGVRIFELERTGGAERSDTGGSSSASLHAKTFAVDRERLFVGSFNFDPRSAELNTEMGLVIHSPALAVRLAESFDTHVPSRAYEVRLSADGKLSWIERTPEGEERYDTEPGVGSFRRATVGLLSILPIERELKATVAGAEERRRPMSVGQSDTARREPGQEATKNNSQGIT